MVAQGWSKQLTARDFYAFHMHDRPGRYKHGQWIEGGRDTLLRAGRCFQEYIISAFAKMENLRLEYLKKETTQKTLRVEEYDQLLDHIANPAEGPVGKRVVLPSTYPGGPRDMQMRYQDAMAIVRVHGKPDLFITMTCNPKWPVRIIWCSARRPPLAYLSESLS